MKPADFGDVLTFDTTYRTNRYSMPLAMFVGFNSNLQNVVFAQALIRDEKTDTFEWVIKQFKCCMASEKEPRVIFTGTRLLIFKEQLLNNYIFSMETSQIS